MDSHIADAVPPLIDLPLDVHKISEGTQGPEVLAEVIDAFFDFSLFLGRPDVAGVGNDLEDPQKIQEGVIETDDAAAAFRDGGHHIVEQELFRGSVKVPEGVEQSLMEGLLFLGMGKLDIKHAAVAFDDSQGVKLSDGFPISQAAKVPPVDLNLLSRGGFEANECLPVSAPFPAFLLEIRPEDSDPAGESLFPEPLENHRGFDIGELLQEGIDHLSVGIEL